MKIKKVLGYLASAVIIVGLIVGMIVCQNAVNESKKEKPRSYTPYELMWYYPFDESLPIEQPNYLMRSSHNRIKLAGHEVTSFDEEEEIAKFLHSAGYKGYKEIKKLDFKKTDYYFEIFCGYYSYPMEEMAHLTFYDNGHIRCETTLSYANNQTYYFKLDEEDTKAFFEVVEKDIAKVENGERHYYEDIKNFCSLDVFSTYAETDLARDDKYTNLDLDITHPYRVATGYLSSNLSDSRKDHIQVVYDMIKDTPHTFKGLKSVSYNSIENSLLAMSYKDDYACYAYIMEGGCNFTKAGVTMLYGDYKDGEYHFLVAEYEIDSEKGEAIYNKAFEPLTAHRQ